MKITITTDGGIPEALKYAKEHVVVKRADLRKIARLAKKHGFYAELKAIGMMMQEIEVMGGPGKASS